VGLVLIAGHFEGVEQVDEVGELVLVSRGGLETQRDLLLEHLVLDENGQRVQLTFGEVDLHGVLLGVGVGGRAHRIGSLTGEWGRVGGFRQG